MPHVNILDKSNNKVCFFFVVFFKLNILKTHVSALTKTNVDMCTYQCIRLFSRGLYLAHVNTHAGTHIYTFAHFKKRNTRTIILKGYRTVSDTLEITNTYIFTVLTHPPAYTIFSPSVTTYSHEILSHTYKMPPFHPNPDLMLKGP